VLNYKLKKYMQLRNCTTGAELENSGSLTMPGTISGCAAAGNRSRQGVFEDRSGTGMEDSDVFI
jgi:hypothetical protein